MKRHAQMLKKMSIVNSASFRERESLCLGTRRWGEHLNQKHCWDMREREREREEEEKREGEREITSKT